MDTAVIPLDCMIIGGGVAGLFALHRCLAADYQTLLLESKSLGTGQTIDSQGIIHGGLKYAITGTGASSAGAIRDMPLVWRRCLAGEAMPDLSNVKLRSDYCYIWRTDSLRSKLGWLAAKFALRTKPRILEDYEVPLAFKGIDGAIARIDEQVIEPRSLLEVLSHSYNQHILQTVEGGIDVTKHESGWLVRLLNPETGEHSNILANKIVLTAGQGNEGLRALFSLERGKTQSRPLHMLMARGDLPTINGHCIDGSKTRVTITTTHDYENRTIWQIGGQIAEDGVHKTPEELIRYGANELRVVLPDVDLHQAEFKTYKTVRAECNTKGNRPSDISVLEENDVLTCWPTKLAFAPRLADEIVHRLPTPTDKTIIDKQMFAKWPTPTVALPPWDSNQPWVSIDAACKQ